MGFVNPNITINQNGLGHSQSWRLKNRKSIIIMTNNLYKNSLLLFFDICALLLAHTLRSCQF